MNKKCITKRIEYSFGDTIKIKPLFDIHYGSTLCDVVELKKYLLDSDDKTYFVGGGDFLDSIIVTDKRYRKGNDIFNSEEIIDEQIDGLYKILEPYKDKFIGLGCLSEDTEVLTENGWRFYNEVKKGDCVLSLNIENDCMEYKPIEKIISYFVDKDLYNIKGCIHDQLVTEDHSVLYKKRLDNKNKKDKEKYYYTTPNKLKLRTSIPTCGKYKEGKININPDMAALLGWVITKSSFLKEDSGNGIYIYQSVKNQNFIDEIIQHLNNLGFEYTIENKKHSGERTKELPWIAIYIKAKFAKEIRKFITTKNITREILNTWDYKSLCILKEAMIKGVSVASYNKNTNSYQTTYYLANKELADFFAELCIKTNTSISLSKRERVQLYKGYDKPVNTVEYSIRILSKKRKLVRNITKVPYKGIVFDFSIKDNHNFVCRRKGKPFITGNCGNHEDTIVQKCATNPIKRLCNKMSVPYLGYSWFLKLLFSEKGARGRTVIIHGHHGFGGGSRTQGADLTKYSKDISFYDASIFLRGHVHRLQFDEIPQLGIIGENLVNKPRILIICGSFKKSLNTNGDTTWEEKQGFPPVKIGGSTILIKPNSTWVDIKVSL